MANNLNFNDQQVINRVLAYFLPVHPQFNGAPPGLPPISDTWRMYDEIQAIMDRLEDEALTVQEVFELNIYDMFLQDVFMEVWDIRNPPDPDNPDFPRRLPGVRMWKHRGPIRA